MIFDDGYVIYQIPNKLIIELPQTLSSIANTCNPINTTRRQYLSTDEMAQLLIIIKNLYENNC